MAKYLGELNYCHFFDYQKPPLLDTSSESDPDNHPKASKVIDLTKENGDTGGDLSFVENNSLKEDITVTREIIGQQNLQYEESLEIDRQKV